MSLNYDQLATKHSFSVSVVQHLAQAIADGNGTIAQFNHPELGGMGQWMSGMVMIGDAFNLALKSKVSALCEELAEAYRSGKIKSTSVNTSMMSSQWWPANLTNPSITGGQNNLRYAYFPQHQRLIIVRDDHETMYRTAPHLITGVSQQQINQKTMLVFHTQSGQTLYAHEFEIIHP